MKERGLKIMGMIFIIIFCLLVLFIATGLRASGGGGGGGGGGGDDPKNVQESLFPSKVYGPSTPYPSKEAAEKAAAEEARQSDQYVKQGSFFIKGCFIETAGQ